MDEKTFLATIGIGLLSFGLVSKRIERHGITPPMAFVSLGILMSMFYTVTGSFFTISLLSFLAEMALVLILFTDASQIELKRIIKNRLPLRLLFIGLPLTIFLGTLVGKWVFPSLSLLEAGFLAILLAPTDLALGKGVLTHPLIPQEMKEALHTESGLNDGLTLPFLVAAIAFSHQSADPVGKWLFAMLLQIALGALVGAIIGYVSGYLIETSSDANWMLPVYQRLTAIGLALLAYSLSEFFYGNGFIGTFAAGITLRIRSENLRKHLIGFGEAEGEQLAIFMFLLFGGIFLPRVWDLWTIKTFLYVLCSLTFVRMLPVALSLFGSGKKWPSILFMGWFGPRGIATILFSLTLFQKADLFHEGIVLSVAYATVLVSIFAHGFTAYPGAKLHHRLVPQ